MTKPSEWLKSWFFPTTSKETESEIDSLNVKNIHYVSLVIGIVQTISLVVFLIMNHNRINESEVLYHPRSVRLFIGSFLILLVVWSMVVSVWNYINHQQLLTFYTVGLIAALFVKLHPVFTTTVIFGSYIVNYLILNFGFERGVINPYNYMMLGALSVIGAIMNYRLTVGYISEKNKANMLNNSLEIIANHDSITRLQNRYALNQHVPDLSKKISASRSAISTASRLSTTPTVTVWAMMCSRALPIFWYRFFPLRACSALAVMNSWSSRRTVTLTA